MLLEIIVIPFLLGFNIILPEEEKANYDPEYLYEMNKTTTTLREPVLQTDQLTSTVTCHIFVTDLRCFLHNIVYLSTVTYNNFNVTYVVSKEHIKSEQWFQIKFNRHGVRKVLVNQTTDERIKNIIQDIVNQFNIDVEPKSNVSAGLFKNSFTVKEKVPIGSCVTTYTLHTMLSAGIQTYNNTGHPEDEKDAGVIMYALPGYYDYRTYKFFLIEKNRRDCNYSLEFFTSLNGMEVTEYTHVIQASNDNVHKNLNMVTVLLVRLPPDPWSSLNMSMFTEITQLNLINIQSPKTKLFDTSYIWVDM